MGGGGCVVVRKLSGGIIGKGISNISLLAVNLLFRCPRSTRGGGVWMGEWCCCPGGGGGLAFTS